MPHCTLLSQELETRLWEQTQGRQTRFIEAQEEARLREGQIAAIRAAYTFSRYDFRTFYQGDDCIQAAMLIENPDDVNDRFVVCCNVETGEEVWTVQTPPFKAHLGPLFISAVQARIASNQSAKAVN